MSLADYFVNWNSDIISISAVLTAVLMLSGYFYGRVFQRFIPQLERTDSTVFGVLFIFAIFQLEIFWAVMTQASTQIAYILLLVTIGFSPFLCLFTWSNILPSWKHLVSLITGIVITTALCYSSSKLTTMNIFSDAITYLSQTIESMEADYFGRIVYTSGHVWGIIDTFRDFNGYCYFWAMLLKFVKEASLFTYEGLYVPIYIWGGTMLFGMSLSSLIVSSVNILFTEKKWEWKGFLVSLAALSPFYTNYWNTTLGFFGNTIRTVAIGAAFLVVYLILKKRSFGLFLVLIPIYLAGICFSSTSFFVCAFLTMVLFFSLCMMKTKSWKTWIGFILSCIPIIQYALTVFLCHKMSYWMITGLWIVIIAVLCFVAWAIRNHYEIFNKIGLILLPVVFIGLVGYSLFGKTAYDMSYYFVSRSENDMTLNMTSHTSTLELIRNIVFYALCACCFINFKKDKRFKILLLMLGILILNPLVEPAVSTFFTSEAYSRSFDLLTNPFTIIFLIYNFDSLLNILPVNLIATAGLAVCSLVFFGIPNLTKAPSKAMEPPAEGYDWKLKITKDSADIYKYVQDILSNKENRTNILSQDVGLKGYVTDIFLNFTAVQYRDTLSGQNRNPDAQELVKLMYPDNQFVENANELFNEELDYSKLPKLFQEFAKDYIIFSNKTALWDERGWYTSAYQSAIDSGLVSLVYQNDSWAILKMNPDWEPRKKSEDRYWVHMY